ncbi:hypothetical protein CHARACLAT_022873 [Characodon lateralis]|uniref:Uncharacterized protein n=1 Tax=Characodon lateralis TaxID=208331 RepID=A0ABU7DJ40_9TELE|nr:hypothetical protein [Characodon lateralis]
MLLADCSKFILQFMRLQELMTSRGWATGYKDHIIHFMHQAASGNTSFLLLVHCIHTASRYQEDSANKSLIDHTLTSHSSITIDSLHHNRFRFDEVLLSAQDSHHSSLTLTITRDFIKIEKPNLI